jgi:hypothetical protein
VRGSWLELAAGAAALEELDEAGALPDEAGAEDAGAPATGAAATCFFAFFGAGVAASGSWYC